jgi:hypothetical protein
MNNNYLPHFNVIILTFELGLNKKKWLEIAE